MTGPSPVEASDRPTYGSIFASLRKKEVCHETLNSHSALFVVRILYGFRRRTACLADIFKGGYSPMSRTRDTLSKTFFEYAEYVCYIVSGVGLYGQ